MMIPVKNVYYMLAYAFTVLRQNGYKNLEGEEFEHIHDLFAAIIVIGVSTQLKQGLYKAYQVTEEDTAVPRGKIEFAQTVKRNTLQKHRLICSFDIFTENTLQNRILKCCVLFLIRHGKVSGKNKCDLRKLLPYFSNVKEIIPTSIQWKQLQLHKGNQSYKFLMFICHLVLHDMLICEKPGQYKMQDYLDERQMSNIYERFVRNYYRIEHPELKVTAPIVKWDTDNGEQGILPRMETDIVLENGDRTLIIDTKYYQKGGLRLSQHSSTEKLISNNLYQIFCYVKNAEAGKEIKGKVSGVLLYALPKDENPICEENSMSGNRIGVYTLDLGQDFEVIKTRLDEIAYMYL